MNPTIRRIAVSGSAAVALLGGAAAITVASPSPASAVEFEAAVNQATGVPVKLPDGRTVYIRGLDTAAYKASPEQHSVIVLAAAKTDSTDPNGISNGVTPDGGQGAAIQNPNTPATGVQTGYNQQIQTQAGGGTIAIGVVVIIVLGTIAFFRVKGTAKVGDAILFAFLGVAMSGTIFGVMAKNVTENGVGSLGGILGGL